jgi:hypothetical protein
MDSERIEKQVAAMRRNPAGVRFSDLRQVCEHYFGQPKPSRGSHVVFRTPWPGNPRINIQDDKGMAKLYQVKQVLAAIRKLKEQNHGRS